MFRLIILFGFLMFPGSLFAQSQTMTEDQMMEELMSTLNRMSTATEAQQEELMLDLLQTIFKGMGEDLDPQMQQLFSQMLMPYSPQVNSLGNCAILNMETGKLNLNCLPKEFLGN